MRKEFSFPHAFIPALEIIISGFAFHLPRFEYWLHVFLRLPLVAFLPRAVMIGYMLSRACRWLHPVRL